MMAGVPPRGADLLRRLPRRVSRTSRGSFSRHPELSVSRLHAKSFAEVCRANECLPPLIRTGAGKSPDVRTDRRRAEMADDPRRRIGHLAHDGPPRAPDFRPSLIFPAGMAILLVALIDDGPGAITKTSKALRILSIALVLLMVLSALVSTVITHQGSDRGRAAVPERDDAADGRRLRLADQHPGVRLAVLGIRLRRPGGACPGDACEPGLRLPPTVGSRDIASRLAPAVRRLLLRGGYETRCVQSDGRDAARPMGETHDGAASRHSLAILGLVIARAVNVLQ